MNQSDENLILTFRPRAKTELMIEIPSDVYLSLRQVAEERSMSVDALLKLYIGQNLRQDLAKVFAERVLARTANMLAKHIASEEERAQMLQEIRSGIPS